uniref:Putative ovule protein n=1 Tax=Solanum chacoense TaxID=4108 RepID=A0A0V0GZC8_SOLCH
MFIIISLGLNIYICILFFLRRLFSLNLMLYLRLKPSKTLRDFFRFSPLITLAWCKLSFLFPKWCQMALHTDN